MIEWKTMMIAGGYGSECSTAGLHHVRSIGESFVHWSPVHGIG